MQDPGRIAFFSKAGFTHIDEKLPGLLLCTQFDSCRRIVAECPDRKAGEKYMESLMIIISVADCFF